MIFSGVRSSVLCVVWNEMQTKQGESFSQLNILASVERNENKTNESDVLVELALSVQGMQGSLVPSIHSCVVSPNLESPAGGRTSKSSDMSDALWSCET